MKKVLALILILALILPLGGCGETNSNDEKCDICGKKASTMTSDGAELCSYCFVDAIEWYEKQGKDINPTPTSRPVTPKPTVAAPQSNEDSNALISAEKWNIVDWIYDRYDYYDGVEGKYSGEKYTETIWKEAMEKFDLTYEEVDAIWMS